MNTVAFTPNGLRYLVLPDPIEAKSETIGEITISQQADVHQKASEGTVVAVGDGTRLEEARTYTVLNGCKYKLGDKVIYGKYAGYEHPFDGVEYKVLGEAEILGKRIVTPFDPERKVWIAGEMIPVPAGRDLREFVDELRLDRGMEPLPQQSDGIFPQLCLVCNRPIEEPALGVTRCAECYTGFATLLPL